MIQLDWDRPPLLVLQLATLIVIGGTCLCVFTGAIAFLVLSLKRVWCQFAQAWRGEI